MIVTIGLVLIFNGLAGLIWSAEVRAFPSPFPNDTWEIGRSRSRTSARSRSCS